MNFYRLFLLFLAVSLAACGTNLPEKTSTNYGDALKSFYVGLAALQAGDDARANEALTKATRQADGEPAAWANLGILQIRQKDFDSAAQSLEKARALDDKNWQIYQTIALLETQRGSFDAAQQNWRKTIDLNPQNAKAVYALAKEKERQTDDAAARKLYENILEIKPDNLAAQIEIVRLAAKQNDLETVKKIVSHIATRSNGWEPEIKTQFDALGAAANSGEWRQIVSNIAFFRNILLRLPAFRAAVAEIKYSDTTLGEPFTKPLKLPMPDFSPAPADENLSFTAQNSDASKAVWSKAIFLNGEDAPTVIWGDEKQIRGGANPIAFFVENSSGAAEIDFDYDFKTDLALAGAQGFRLFRQDNGNFTDVTAQTKIPNEITQKSYAGAWVFDAESDGDLDLILAATDGAPVVLQNNSDNTFTKLELFGEVKNVRQFASADLDEDGDADAILLDANKDLHFFSNERGGLYKKRNLPASVGKISAITIADANGDGKLDLTVLQIDGKVLRITDKLAGTEWESAELFQVENASENSKIIAQDFDNNGAIDFLIADEIHTRIWLGGKDYKFVSITPIAAPIFSIADVNADGKLDLIGVNAEKTPTNFLSQSAKNYNWQTIHPRAAKTSGDQRVNSYGIGGELEMRAGLLTQKQLITEPQVHFGLGEQPGADVLRVVWQNGYVQADFDLKPNQIIAAEQRLKGSCPHLFAFDGEKFKMVKDAPPWSPALGLKINAQDTYGVLATEEWFKIPGEAIKPTKENFYELRITGEYWESFYIDQYSLLVVDHPENTEVFTDERFAIPLPPLKVFTTEQTKKFASAKNDKGEDVASIVKTLDEKYLDGIERGTFQGVAKDHFVELELPTDAPTDKKIWIVADGWVHPTDASINVQLGQSSKEKPRGLSLEIQDEAGNWKIAKENLGFPAGKMKTVLIDVPAGARRFRLRTNMEVFWDKLAWGVDIAEDENKTSRLELNSAELHYRGFSVMEKADDSSPEKPDYDRVLTTTQRWRSMEGYYTRFGDVRELLTKVDDRYVLMNAGDEVVLKFSALPEVRKDFRRDFVLIGDGWIKDGDLNSVFSKTLLPLPTHATNDYSTPPTVLENDPIYQKHKADWTNFHTRYVSPDDFRNALR